MIKQNIFLKDYYWNVDVYYAVDCYYIDEIIERIVQIGCTVEAIEDARKLLNSRTLNTGLTYSNINKHSTVIVIALTNSSAEFANSLVHEIAHLSQHISEAFNLDPYGEEVCYIQGEVMREMYIKCHTLLCDSCRTAKVQHTSKCCTN